MPWSAPGGHVFAEIITIMANPLPDGELNQIE